MVNKAWKLKKKVIHVCYSTSSRLSLLGEELPSECLSTSYCPGLLHSTIYRLLLYW